MHVCAHKRSRDAGKRLCVIPVHLRDLELQKSRLLYMWLIFDEYRILRQLIGTFCIGVTRCVTDNK